MQESRTTSSTQPPHDFTQWEEEIAAFEQADREQPAPHNAILFVGSSTIRLWETLAEDFPEYQVINRGFGGSEVIDATHFADRIIFPYEPRMIIFRTGGNAIAAGKTPEQVIADFDMFVRTIHTRLPDTPIVVISLSASIARWNLAEQNRTLSNLFKDYIDGKPLLQYVEAYDLPLDADGQPRPELFADDGLHLNREGYKLLAERVHPYLPQL